MSPGIIDIDTDIIIFKKIWIINTGIVEGPSVLTGFEMSAKSSRVVRNEPVKKCNLTLQVPTQR
jgi:hypothetical protein